MTLLLFISSFAFLAASRALLASIALPTITFATSSFISKYSGSFWFMTVSTRPFISLLPSFAFVCPSNCGFCIFTLMTATRPSFTSSPERFSLMSFLCSAKLLMQRVRADRKPATWEPPSWVLTLFTKL